MPDTAARPFQVVDADLHRALPALDGVGGVQAWVLVRRAGEPLGAVTVDVPEGGLQPEELRRILVERRPDVAADSGFSRVHADYLTRAATATVVVCSRENPQQLRRCLRSLVSQDHPDFSVLVVDNAPQTTATRHVADELADELDLRYVLEPRPGLSRARNTALAQNLRGEIVAWLDDDEVADPLWLSEIVRAFDGRPDVAAASGLVAPAELETKAQVWFEEFGGHSKGRGFTAQEFSPATRREQHPLFPLPPFGVGANMAFRIEALRRVGFDEALGAGTATQGGEDTKVFTDLLLAGATTRYWPTALTRHYHRRDTEGLAKQLRGYGTGLTAYYTACVRQRPSTLLTLARLAPRALREVRSSGGLREAGLSPDFPLELLHANRRAMLEGPLAYLRTRRRQRA